MGLEIIAGLVDVKSNCLAFSFTHRDKNILSSWAWKAVGKLSSCNWVFCKNELSP